MCFSLVLLLFSLGLAKKHAISLILTLEILLLCVVLVLVEKVEGNYTILLIRVGACEAAVGLGAMVSLARVKDSLML